MFGNAQELFWRRITPRVEAVRLPAPRRRFHPGARHVGQRVAAAACIFPIVPVGQPLATKFYRMARFGKRRHYAAIRSGRIAPVAVPALMPTLQRQRTSSAVVASRAGARHCRTPAANPSRQIPERRWRPYTNVLAALSRVTARWMAPRHAREPARC